VRFERQMSEEESNFKVTDRRLFNSDGSPREIEPEPAPEAAAPPVEGQTNTPPAEPDATTVAATAPADSSGAGADEPVTRDTTDETAALSLDESDSADDGIPGANDPSSFINFLMSIASNAASALGMMEHPVTGERAVDLELGKHWIDILGMLEEKTRGNLHPQEEQIFKGLLSDLRMQFVALTKNPPRKPGAPGGLTGRDIIGGS
jgi:hypothetical protein